MEARNQALWSALTVQSGRRASSAFVNVAKHITQALDPLPSGFPPGPGYDAALQLAADPLRFMESVKGEYGGLAGFKLAMQPIVLVSSPDLAKEVFYSGVFVKAGTAFFPGSSLAGNGLLVSDGEVWLRQRRLCNPGFKQAAVDTYEEAMEKLSHEMISSWPQDGIRDVYKDFNELTMKIVSTALFGNSVEDSNSMEEVVSSITTAFKFFTERATSMFIVPEWVPTLSNIQYHAAVARLDQAVYKMINERRLQHASLSVKQDLLSRLLLARDEDDTGMGDVALRDELMTLLVAGQETSSIVLAWCLVMLAKYENVQDRMFAEVCRDGAASFGSLHYTKAVIMETMRLLPPAYIVGRCASRDTTLGGWSIPSGTTALISLYLLHRDSHAWPRALDFDPCRWLTISEHQKPYLGGGSYWPFGGGPRNCIGSAFAMMELSLVLSAVIRMYKISLPSGSSFPKSVAMITLRPQSPLYLRLTRRR